MLLALVAVAGCFRVQNLDLGLHARTGEWILEHREVPNTNVMSPIHGDYSSVHDKWGFQVLAHLVWDGGGASGVIALRLLCMLALFAVLWRTAMRLGGSPGLSLFVLSLALLAMRSRFLFRPGLVSLLFLALVLHGVLVSRADGRKLGWLVLLQLIWVNVHGYFLLGFLAVGAVAAGHFVRGLLGRRDGYRVGLRLAVLAVAMALVSLLNPSGVEGFLHPYSILQDLHTHLDFYRQTIDEFRPTFASDPRGSVDRWAFLSLFGLSLLALLWDGLGRRKAAASEAASGYTAQADAESGDASHDAPQRVGLGTLWLPALMLVVLFGVMSRTLRRSMALYAVAIAPLLAASLTACLGRVRGPRTLAPAGGRLGLLIPGLFALCIAGLELSDWTSVHDGLERRSGFGVSRLAYPDRGLAFLAEELPQHDVFTAFRYGSTLTGRRWPEQAAATNGNTHGYPTSYFMSVMKAVSMEDPIAFDRLVDQHGHTAALIPMDCRLAARLLRRTDWRLVVLGVSEALFVRGDGVDETWLARHDLEQRLRRGDRLGQEDIPASPACGTVLGIPKSCRPGTELAAAVMLRGAGLRDTAQHMLTQALGHSPDDSEALSLQLLLAVFRGDELVTEDVQQLLRRPGFNRFEGELRGLLDPASP